MSDSPASPAAPAAGRGASSTVQPTRWQSAVARRTAEARATVPDLDFSVDVDASALLGLAERLGIGLTALHVRACALALREHPDVNAAYRDGRFERYERVNIGVLIATPDAYTMPTVFDADRKSPAEIRDELAVLEAGVRAGTLPAPALSGATFTLSDLGPLGVDRSTPVPVPGQAAAVCTGAVRAVPVVRGGAIVAGNAITVTLACDHRILYGAAAASFLGSLKSRLEEASL